MRTCDLQECDAQHYAKGLCANHYSRMRYRSADYRTGGHVPCSGCGKPCPRGSRSKPAGERRCRACGWAKPKAEKPVKMVPCHACGVEITPRGGKVKLCAPCAAERRAERDRDKCRRRRARKLHVRYEPYTTREIAARDGFRCGICGDPVDMTRSGLDEYGPTIDHVIPLVRGGADAPDNVQLAHRACNTEKSDRLL